MHLPTCHMCKRYIYCICWAADGYGKTSSSVVCTTARTNLLKCSVQILTWELDTSNSSRTQAELYLQQKSNCCVALILSWHRLDCHYRALLLQPARRERRCVSVCVHLYRCWPCDGLATGLCYLPLDTVLHQSYSDSTQVHCDFELVSGPL